MDKIRQYLYYILIAAISFVSLTVFPMLDSSFALEARFPQNAYGWFVWGVTKGTLCVLNIFIFHCFLRQGDENTRNHENRKEAERLLKLSEEEKEYKPRSPKKYYQSEYSKKIPSLVITTTLSLIAFVPVFADFNVSTFVTYLFTVFMAVVLGILEMLKTEEYYKNEFLEYAKEQRRKEEEKIQMEPKTTISFENEYLGRNKKC